MKICAYSRSTKQAARCSTSKRLPISWVCLLYTSSSPAGYIYPSLWLQEQFDKNITELPHAVQSDSYAVSYTHLDVYKRQHLSREAILREIDGTLQRLGTDYLDLYIIHRYDADTPVEETMEALDSLVRAGKVRALGASAMYG